ncbi:TPA: hypothetical protein ACH3X2_004830 [Trebouxia sp. C0005]
MKADIEVLHGPLLDQVLGKLECCQDLLRCAAVCKLWLQVASKVQPTSLYLPPLWRCRESPITPQEVLQVMQWLHRKQHAGYFGRLEQFTLGIAAADEEVLDPACYQGDLLSAFIHSSLVYVSFWQLQVLDLGGPVHLDTVLPLLPTALLDLSLQPHCKHMPYKCCLSAFERLSQLTSLALGCYDGSPAKHVRGSFVLDVCLPTLEILNLDPWPIKAHEDHPVAQSLPNVRILTAHIACSKAQSLVVLPSIELLGLILHDVVKSTKAFGTKIPSINILSGSKLRRLHLVGPLATPFRLDLSERPDHLYVAHYDCGRKSNCLIMGQQNSFFPWGNMNMLHLHYEDVCTWY